MLDAALREWRALLGADDVLVGDEALAPYTRSTQPREPHRPMAALRPDSAEQVPDIVAIANRHRVPLYPISTGKNWGYGDASPSGPGQVVVDLGRLNRIVEVNEQLAYAVIEPGVTQGQLSRHLRDNAIGLWTDCTGAGPDTSIVGNILERGFGHTPYGNRFQSICGMDVVLGNGEMLKTGFGHHPRAGVTRVYPYGIGPVLDGLFTQSNFGIVTRLGIWLLPKPESFTLFLCLIDRHEDLVETVERLRRLKLEGTLRSVAHIGNDVRILTGRGRRPRDASGGTGPLSPGIRAVMRRGAGIGAWSLSAGLYGSRSQVAAARRRVRELLRGRGRKLVFLDERMLKLGGAAARAMRATPWGAALRNRLETATAVFDLHQGVPVADFLAGAYWARGGGLPPNFPREADPAADNCGLVWLSPVIPMTGEAAMRLCDVAEPIVNSHGFDFAATLSLVNERAIAAVLSIAFDRGDPAERERAAACHVALGDRLAAEGFPPYRGGSHALGALADASENFWPTVVALKRALDPAGIIAPGRYAPTHGRDSD